MKLNLAILLSLLFIPCYNWIYAQESPISISSQQQIRVNKAASKLSRSLGEDANEERIAEEYQMLAKELSENREYDKAEEYLKKSIQIYSKQNKKEKLYNLNRELARIQELQKNYDDAIKSYEVAAVSTKNKKQKQICENDINRLKYDLFPEKKSDYIQQNISLIEKKGTSSEKAEVYQQMAEANLQLNRKDVAIENYEKALSNANNLAAENKQIEAAKIQNKIAGVYVADKQYDKAIDINKELIKEAAENADIERQIGQLQTLSSVYFIDDKKEQGIELLKQAYDLALEKGKTIEAKKSLELLTEQYLKEKNYKQSIDLYKDFLQKLDYLIQSDSTLIDAKIFQITDDKIKQLEKEKELKDRLIQEKNTFNFVLIISVILMMLLLLLIIKALYANKIKGRKIALQSLRREMNPHFIFNSLNSVNQFIAQNNELEANKFLTSYSKLMRNVMENSNKDFIKLNKEIELLKEYLELEHLRFGDKFSYKITVDEEIDPETISIPNMLIQPHVENAIWHGLRYKEGKGLLELSFSLKDNRLLITVEDDGIGLKKSREIKTENQKVHQSRGLTNVGERIELLNRLYKTNIRFEVKEKEEGVIVEIYV
ncbi:MAG: histidine kinase [Dysgonamonadaceae bacterium]|jgi:sensor histidine kinase YesM|nr:histidine kinase [Dysgonamonadaceae bacterium]